MNKFPAWSTATPSGSLSRMLAAAVPSAESPGVPVGLPATVYRSPAVTGCPHWVPEADGISSTRLPSPSAKYTPELAYTTLDGVFTVPPAAGTPELTPSATPSREYTSAGPGAAADSDDPQLSAHPNPIGPGTPAFASCCATPASYVRVKSSDGP